MHTLAQFNKSDLNLSVPVQQPDMTAVLGRPLTFEQAYDYLSGSTDGFESMSSEQKQVADRFVTLMEMNGIISDEVADDDVLREELEAVEAALSLSEPTDPDYDMLMEEKEALEAALSL